MIEIKEISEKEASRNKGVLKSKVGGYLASHLILIDERKKITAVKLNSLKEFKL